MTKSEKIISFDSWRFLLCIVIILHHTGINIYSFHGLSNPYFNMGHLAVECFFVLSGFLLTKSFFLSALNNANAGYIAAQSFLRRIKRLYPEYIVALLACAVLTSLFSHDVPLSMFLLNAIGIAGMGGVPNIINGVWYVAVLFWGGGVLFNLMCYYGKKAFFLIFPIISMLCLFYLYNHGANVSGHQLPIEFNLLSKGIIRGILGLTIGVYTFLICNFIKDINIHFNKRNTDMLLFVLEIAAVYLLAKLLLFSKGNSFNVYFYASFITGLLYFKKEILLKFLSWKIWNRVSYLAFMLYLTHLIVLEIVRVHWKGISAINPVCAYSIIVFVSIVFSWFCYKIKDYVFKILNLLFIDPENKGKKPLNDRVYSFFLCAALFMLSLGEGVNLYIKHDRIIYKSETMQYINANALSVYLQKDKKAIKEFTLKKSKKIRMVEARYFTWNNKYKGNLIISLWNGKYGENLIQRATYDLNKIKDNAVNKIKFPQKIKLKKGCYAVSFETTENDKDFAVSALKNSKNSSYIYDNSEIKDSDLQITIR